MWIIWLIIAAIFLAAEVFTPGFFLLWFGIGAGVAAALAALGVGSFAVQIMVFLIVSVALLIASRTILEKWLPRSTQEADLRSGVGTMIGQIGTVVEASSGALQQGAVRVYGSVWTAFPAEGEAPLRDGESVSVERIEGNAIYVRSTGRPRPLFDKTSESS